MYPVGSVTARPVECGFIAVGRLGVMTIVTLRQHLAGGGADSAALEAVGRSLVALHDRTFLPGPGFVVGVGNGLMLGYLKPSPIPTGDPQTATAR